MKQPSIELVRAVREHAKRIHLGTEHHFPGFLEAARDALPERAQDPQFGYVVRRLWMEAELDEKAFWECGLVPSLRASYESLDAETAWQPEGSPVEEWMCPPLIQRTLSLWQMRVPHLLSVRHAVRMLRATARLADLGGVA